MGRRFFLFGIGAVIGSFFVYFTLIKDRGREGYSSYFPNGRVLKKVVQGIDTTSLNLNCWLNCNRLSVKDFRMVIKESEVDFDKSNTKADVKIFLINSQFAGLNYTYQVNLKDTFATLNYLYTIGVERDCDCDTKSE